MTYFLFLCLPQHLLPAEGQWLGTNKNKEVMRSFKLCVNHSGAQLKAMLPLEAPTAQCQSNPTRLHPSQTHLEILHGPRTPKPRAPNFI